MSPVFLKAFVPGVSNTGGDIDLFFFSLPRHINALLINNLPLSIVIPCPGTRLLYSQSESILTNILSLIVVGNKPEITSQLLYNGNWCRSNFLQWQTLAVSYCVILGEPCSFLLSSVWPFWWLILMFYKHCVYLLRVCTFTFHPLILMFTSYFQTPAIFVCLIYKYIYIEMTCDLELV